MTCFPADKLNSNLKSLKLAHFVLKFTCRDKQNTTIKSFLFKIIFDNPRAYYIL